jgi:hypothetical protein
MEANEFHELEQNAPLAVDQPLGQPCGSGGVYHPERVIKRNLLKDQLALFSEKVLP